MPYLLGSAKFLHSAYVQKGEGRVVLEVFPSIYLTKLPKPTNDFRFRWVIASGSSGGRMTNIKWNDYNDVKAKLGLKE